MTIIKGYKWIAASFSVVLVIFFLAQYNTEIVKIGYKIVPAAPRITEHIEIPTTNKINRGFRPAKEFKSYLYVYSALRNGQNLRIVAVKKRNQTLKGLSCLLWNATNKQSAQVMSAKVDEVTSGPIINEYVAAFITCYGIKNGDSSSEIVASPDREALNSSLAWAGLTNNIEKGVVLVSLPVEGSDPSESIVSSVSNQNIENFTVCIKPMHSNYSDEAKLVEMMEMTRIFGADRVVFYNYSISPGVDAILRWYKKISLEEEGLRYGRRIRVEFRHWNIYVLSNDTRSKQVLNETVIFDNGHLASLEDCISLNRWRSRYVVLADIDEFLVPFRHNTWSELIAHRSLKHPKAIGFMFRNTFYDTLNPSPAKGFEVETTKYKSAILGYTKRYHIYRPYGRSKMIIDPRKVEMMELHYILKPYKRNVDIIPIQEGLMLHYRTRPDHSLILKTTEDTRVSDMFGKRLVSQLGLVWSALLQQRGS